MNELPINQPEGTHQVTVTRDDKGYLVRCNECPRLWWIDNNSTPTILVKGDVWASHSFGTGGLTITGIKVRTEADSNVERLLNDIDL